MAQWKTFDLDGLPPDAVSQAIEDLSGFIGTLSSFVQTLVQILKALKVFLISFPNPLLAALKAVIQIIEGILSNLRETGLYWLSILPDSVEEMDRFQGGYDEFERILINSLYDREDPNRPQFGPNAYMGGAVFNFTALNPSDYIEKAMQLQWAFNRLTDLRFPPPVNVQAQPADNLGQAEGSFTETALSVFTAENQRELNTIRLTWEEPKGQESFLNVFKNAKFYVEQSEDTGRRTPQRERSELETSPQDKEQPPTESLQDRQGKDVVVWEPLDESEPFLYANVFGNLSNPNLFLGPIAGTYGTIIEDIEPGVDNGRFFRVRTVPENVGLQEVEVQTESDDSTENPTKHKLVWGSSGEPYTKSQPSQAVYGFIPGVDTSFDLPSALLNTYRVAYLLRFDRELRNASDEIVIGSDTLSEQVPPPLETLENVGIDGGGITVDTPSVNDSGTVPTLAVPLFPDGIQDWETTRRRESLKKLQDLPTDILEVGDNLIGRFKTKPFDGSSSFHSDIYGTTPTQRWRNFIDRVASDRIRRVLPELLANEELAATIRSDYQDISSDIEAALTGGIESNFGDEEFRRDVKSILGLAEISLTRGQPPNWETIQFFPELLPELDSVLKRAFSLLKSIEGALSSIVQAFTDAIDAITARLRLITSLLDMLDQALSLLELYSELLFTLNFLFVPPDTGGTSGFVSRVQDASNKPEASPEDFTGGFCFAFGAPSTQGFQEVKNAFSFIFQ